jgi:hypothetical protein
MARFYNRFWIGMTVVLCGIFAVLLFPAIRPGHGTLNAALYTLLGILVIWAVYFVRVYVFSRLDENRSGTDDEK